jgi:endogenous inhibitor of DNA gyrase (YacG/DUF329 family)
VSAGAEIRALKRRRAGCPVCGRRADPAERPFCSARCRDVDLGRWVAGDYRIAGETVPAAAERDEA